MVLGAWCLPTVPGLPPAGGWCRMVAAAPSRGEAGQPAALNAGLSAALKATRSAALNAGLDSNGMLAVLVAAHRPGIFTAPAQHPAQQKARVMARQTMLAQPRKAAGLSRSSAELSPRPPQGGAGWKRAACPQRPRARQPPCHAAPPRRRQVLHHPRGVQRGQRRHLDRCPPLPALLMHHMSLPGHPATLCGAGRRSGAPSARPPLQTPCLA